MTRCGLLLILCITGALPSGASAAVYKWTDEQGVTHYGEKPPPGRKTQELQIRTAPASPAAGATKEGDKGRPARGWEEQEREFRQRRVEQLERERKEQEQQARTGDEAKRRCQRARYDLDVFGGGPVYRLDEKGERQFYDDKTRDAIVARAKKEAAENCKR